MRPLSGRLAAGAVARRVPYIDAMRALAILSVVVGHVLVLFSRPGPAFDEGAYKAVVLIYAVHMPLFFFISGLLHRTRAWPDVLTRALTFLLMTEFAFLVSVVAKGAAFGRWLDPAKLLHRLLLLDRISPTPIWFLVAFAVVIVMVRLLENGTRLSRGIVAAMFLASLANTLFLHKRVFQLSTWWVGLIAYLIGWAIAGRGNKRFSWWRASPIGAVAGLFLLAPVAAIFALGNRGCHLRVSDTCGTTFRVRMLFGEYGFLPYFLLAMVAGIFAVVAFSRILTRVLPVLQPFWRWIGKNTLALYLINAFVFTFANPSLRRVLPDHVSGNLPLLLTLTIVALHLLALPAVIPVVRALERATARLSGWLVATAGARIVRAGA